MNNPLFLFSQPIIVAAIILVSFSILTIIHVIKRHFSNKEMKAIWIVLLIGFPASAIVYWIFWFLNKNRMSLE